MNDALKLTLNQGYLFVPVATDSIQVCNYCTLVPCAVVQGQLQQAVLGLAVDKLVGL